MRWTEGRYPADGRIEDAGTPCKREESNNRRKARAKLARLHARIGAIRSDARHQLTTDLTRRFHTIGILVAEAAKLDDALTAKSILGPQCLLRLEYTTDTLVIDDGDCQYEHPACTYGGTFHRPVPEKMDI